MSKPDLNLIVIFDAIMREQSISAAAKNLSMTQPSVSNAVSRMRHVWQDPLFVKSGRTIKSTPNADKLWQLIADPLYSISHAINPEKFEPATAKHCFRVAFTDGLCNLIWLPLRKIIEQHAPNIDIHAVPYTLNAQYLLDNAEADLIADYVPDLGHKFKKTFLCNNYFVAVMSPEHQLASGDLCINELLKADHLLMSLSGQASGSVDSKLAEFRLKRRIATTVNSFSNATTLLKHTNLISVLPYAIIADEIKSGALIAKTLPFDLPPAKISLGWHDRNDRSPSLLWLRQTILDIIHAKGSLFHDKAWE